MITLDKYLAGETKILEELKDVSCNGKRRKYLNVPAAFDCETSSFLSTQDWEPVGLLYIWQFGIGNTIVYGREIEELNGLLNELETYLSNQNKWLVVYVHFLKYDFSFIKKIRKWDEIFSKSQREVLIARTGHIEFRDSLALSGGKSLNFVGNHLRIPIRKLIGSLDYSKIRTPETDLTVDELSYCEHDILILLEYIREKIEDDGSINDIPLTNTGYVRRYVKQQCLNKREDYLTFMDGLTLTPSTYQIAERAFAGGAVGPNINKVLQIWYRVSSYDIKSSYPYVMITGKYPISYFHPVPNNLVQSSWRDHLARHNCLFTVEFFFLEAKTNYLYPISKHKCVNIIGERTASGRVLSALYLKISCTEVDYKLWEKAYNFDRQIISDFRWAYSGYLPKPIIFSVLEFFNRKTVLDGVSDKKQEYMLSKNMLNSVYGMMVEKPIRPDILFVSGQFYKGEVDLPRAIERYNNKIDRILYFPWGVWVTALARERLYKAVQDIGNDFVYVDTDSIKFVGNHDDVFGKFNEEAVNNLRKLSSRLELEWDFIAPKDARGNRKYLGVWEKEFVADRFKTIGAKRYMYETKNGKLHITVAGSNKEGTLAYIESLGGDPFEHFTDKLVIPAEYAKRRIAKFVDEERCGFVKDYTGIERWYDSPSGVYMENASYTFNVTEELKNVVDAIINDAHYQDGDV